MSNTIAILYIKDEGKFQEFIGLPLLRLVKMLNPNGNPATLGAYVRQVFRSVMRIDQFGN